MEVIGIVKNIFTMPLISGRTIAYFELLPTGIGKCQHSPKTVEKRSKLKNVFKHLPTRFGKSKYLLGELKFFSVKYVFPFFFKYNLSGVIEFNDIGFQHSSIYIRIKYCHSVFISQIKADSY